MNVGVATWIARGKTAFLLADMKAASFRPKTGKVYLADLGAKLVQDRATLRVAVDSAMDRIAERVTKAVGGARVARSRSNGANRLAFDPFNPYRVSG